MFLSFDLVHDLLSDTTSVLPFKRSLLFLSRPPFRTEGRTRTCPPGGNRRWGVSSRAGGGKGRPGEKKLFVGDRREWPRTSATTRACSWRDEHAVGASDGFLARGSASVLRPASGRRDRSAPEPTVVAMGTRHPRDPARVRPAAREASSRTDPSVPRLRACARHGQDAGLPTATGMSRAWNGDTCGKSGDQLDRLGRIPRHHHGGGSGTAFPTRSADTRVRARQPSRKQPGGGQRSGVRGHQPARATRQVQLGRNPVEAPPRAQTEGRSQSRRIGRNRCLDTCQSRTTRFDP